MKGVWGIFTYTAHTPRHIPAGLFILFGAGILYLLARLRNRSVTFGDLCVGLGMLGLGSGVVIWALRWKPSIVVNNTTTTPVVNHVTTNVVHSSGGTWRDIIIAIIIAAILGTGGWIWRRMRMRGRIWRRIN